MAKCYHELKKYAEELLCYHEILASNHKPEKYYFFIGKAKVRLIEIYPFVKEAETTVISTYDSLKNFIMSAIEDFDKSMEYSDKYKAEILSYKGVCHFHLGNIQRAMDYLFESNDINLFNPNNFVYFGIYHFKKENFKAAETYLKKGISYNLNTEVPYIYLAKIYFKNKNYDKAMKYAIIALSILSSIDECHYIQGYYYRIKHMYKEAITCFTIAIHLNPKKRYLLLRAECYFNKMESEVEKAYDDMLKATGSDITDPNYINLIFYKANIDNKKGRSIDIYILKELLQPFIKEKENYCFIGLIYHQYNYLIEAEKYYRKAIEYNEKDKAAYYNLTVILRKTGRVKEAIMYILKAIELYFVEDIKFYSLLKKCYNDCNDIYNEITTQKKLDALKRKYMTINIKNGNVVYNEKKYLEAEKYYQIALNYVEDDTPTLNNLACAFFCQGKFEEAKKVLERTIALDRTYYIAYFNLGNCYLQIDATENSNLAKIKYRTAQRLCTTFKLAEQMLESMNPLDIKMIIDETE